MRKKAYILSAAFLLLAFMLSSCLSLRSADSVPLPGDRSEDIFFSASEGAANEELLRYRTAAASPLTGSSTVKAAAPVEMPPSKYAGVSISLLAAGDNLIHPNIYTDAYNRGNENKRYDFLPMYSDIAEAVKNADIAFINQETLMAGEEYGISGYPCFNSPQDLGHDLVTLGFDIINIANNHMLDRSASGLEATIKFWEEQPVLLIGGYKSPEDYLETRITEIDGIRISWLSYTLATNGIVKPASSSLVIPYIDDDLIIEDIERAKSVSDFVIVSIHWGDENTQTPNSEQKRLARLIAENGADLIIGHHSHTVQPIEWIDTEDGPVLCIYSLGNFVSGMASPVNMVGGLLSLDIVGKDDSLEVENVLFTPTVLWYGMDWYGSHIYYLGDYTDALASGHGVRLNGSTLSPEKARAFVTGTIDSEFLPEYLRDN